MPVDALPAGTPAGTTDDVCTSMDVILEYELCIVFFNHFPPRDCQAGFAEQTRRVLLYASLCTAVLSVCGGPVKPQEATLHNLSYGS